MRDAASSPFTPGYGAVPEVWAGRAEEFGDFHGTLLPRLAAGTYEQARLVLGERGVGKTAFLKTLADEAEDADHWPVYVAARRGGGVVGDLLRAVTEALRTRDLARRLTEGTIAAVRSITKVRIAGIESGLERSVDDAGQEGQSAALARLLKEAGELARSRNAVLVLAIDEAQNADRPALGDLCHALQDAQTEASRRRDALGALVRQHLPIGVYVAGLPDLASRIQDTGATFFERSRHLDFGLLRAPDVRDALVAFAGNRDVSIDADALDLLVELIGGYPYFLHLIGARVWTAGSGPVITRREVEVGAVEAQRDIDRFYEERLRDLGRVQHGWMVAAAQLDEADQTVSNVAAALGRRSSELGAIVRSLADRGLVRRLGGGRFRFALPGLQRHLRG